MHPNFLCRDEEGPAYHGKYRARAEKITQSIEERSVFEIMIVLLGEFFGWNNQLDGNKLVTFSLKSRYDLRNLRKKKRGKETHHSYQHHYKCTETRLKRANV